jgi:hypothetical protein
VLTLRAKLSDADLARKLVCCSADGASVMAGPHTGVLTRLLTLAPYMVPMHCMAHRTDLAVGALEMSYLKNRVRNQLDKNLSKCMRLYVQDFYTQHSFPYQLALEKWHKASHRRQ